MAEEKTNKGIASFEDGTGNTMEIIFPKVKKRNYNSADFYNERALLLHKSDTEPKENEKREIRLIYQDVFDRIIKVNPSDDNSITIIDDAKLYKNSSVIDNKITGSQFNKMLEDSNLENGILGDANGENRRIEQASLILFDTNKLEIWLERQNDDKNDYSNSHSYNITNLYAMDDSRRIPIWKPNGHEKNIDTPGVKEVIVIGNVHTHPMHNANEFGRDITLPEEHSNDGDFSSKYSIPVFQIYPENKNKKMNEVDLIISPEKTINKICSTTQLIRNKFDIVRETLKFFNEIHNRI